MLSPVFFAASCVRLSITVIGDVVAGDDVTEGDHVTEDPSFGCLAHCCSAHFSPALSQWKRNEVDR